MSQPPEQPHPYPYPYPYWQQPQWRPPPPIDPKQLSPSRLWYWLSPIPALIGVAIAALFVVQLVDGLDFGMDNFSTSHSVEFRTDAKERAIYVQTRGAPRARNVPASDLHCSVTALDRDPHRVPVERWGSFTLDSNGDSYESVYKFDTSAGHRFRVSCEGPHDVPLAVGPAFSFKTVKPVIGAIIALLAGVGLTAAIAIVVGVKRSNHKQRLQYQAVYGGG